MVVGHQKIVEFLDSAIRGDKLSHAYLFYGPKNIGKTTVAINFIIKLLTKELSPKNKSLIEDQIVKKIYPDVFWVEKQEDKKNIAIEQIRELQDKLSRQSLVGNYKVAVIKQGDEMSLGSFNSFLKVLEEASAGSIIILLMNNLKSVPLTVISRCQIFKFNPVPHKIIFDYLVDQLKLKEKDAKIISSLSFGRPGLAWRYAHGPDLITEHEKEVQSFIKELSSSLQSRIAFVNQRFAEPPFFIWQTVLRDLLLNKFNLPIVNLFIEKQIQHISSQWSADRIHQALMTIELTRRYFGYNINKKLALENFFINL